MKFLNLLRCKHHKISVFTNVNGGGCIMNGENVHGNDVYVHNEGSISFGDAVWLNSFPNGCMFRTALNTYFPCAKISIGNRCKINGTVFHANQEILMGDDCRIGPGTVICDNDSHRVALSVEERSKTPVSAPIHIGNNVWIGMNCIILKGVNIGDNVIIAAGSIVTKCCEPNAIYAGNPAKFIKWIDK